MGTIRDLVIALTVDDDGVESGLDSAADLFKSAAVRMGAGVVGVGAIIGKELMDAFTRNLEFETANAKFAGQLDLTKDEAKSAGTEAALIYSHAYGENIDEVNDAMVAVQNNIAQYAAANMGLSRDMTEGVLNLSQAFDQDLGASTRAVGKLLVTGLAANGKEALDIITSGLQHGADQAGDFLDTINEYSVQFQKVGVTGQQALGMIQNALAAGARDSDIAADAIKEFALIMAAKTPATAQALSDLGFASDEVFDAIATGGNIASGKLEFILTRLQGIPDPMKRAQLATALFGTKAEDLGDALFALNPNLVKNASSFGHIEGAAKRLDESLGGTTQAKITSMQRGFELWTQSLMNVQGPMGTVIASVMAFGPQALPLLASLGMIISGFGGIFMAAGRAAVSVTASFATMMAEGIAASAKIIAQLALQGAKWVWLGVQAMVQAARIAAAWLISMGPIGIIVAAVIALVALIVANWDTIKNAIGAAWEWIKGVTLNAWNWIVDKIKVAVDFITKFFLPFAIVRLIAENWDKIKAGVGIVWDWIVEHIQIAVQRTIDAINWFKELPGRVIGWFTDLTKGAIQRVSDFVTWLKSLPQKILDGIGKTNTLLMNVGRDIINGLWEGIQNMTGWIKDKFTNFFSGLLPDWVKSALGIASPSKVFAGFGRMVMLGFGNGMAAATSSVFRVAGQAVDGLSGILSSPIGASVALAAPEAWGGGYAMPTGNYGVGGVPGGSGGMTQIIVQKLDANFADDRNLYEKGQEFAAGLREYKARGGVIPTP